MSPKQLLVNDPCPECGMNLAYTADGSAMDGDGFDLFCPCCHAVYLDGEEEEGHETPTEAIDAGGIRA